MSGVYQEQLMHKQTDLEYSIECDNLLHLNDIFLDYDYTVYYLPKIVTHWSMLKDLRSKRYVVNTVSKLYY